MSWLADWQQLRTTPGLPFIREELERSDHASEAFQGPPSHIAALNEEHKEQ
jgi:hypothetical protein